MQSLEDKAEAVGANSKSLLKQLNSAKSCLAVQWVKTFKNARFDKENRRLISTCGCYALQWQLRNKPDEPESYENQQTSVGTVVLLQIHRPKQHDVRELTNADHAEIWWKEQGKEVPPRDLWGDYIDKNSPWQKMYRAWLNRSNQ